jgi:hypothetical protein
MLGGVAGSGSSGSYICGSLTATAVLHNLLRVLAAAYV